MLSVRFTLAINTVPRHGVRTHKKRLVKFAVRQTDGMCFGVLREQAETGEG